MLRNVENEILPPDRRTRVQNVVNVSDGRSLSREVSVGHGSVAGWKILVLVT